MTAAWTDALRARIDGLGLACPDGAPERLAAYHVMLADWNERINLTGDADFALSLDRHYTDSLAPLSLQGLFLKGTRLIDVGSGAGFPGLPLAIMRPDMRVTLLDSLGKRVKFLEAVAGELGLQNVSAVHARAEDGARDTRLREGFDIAVARAVAPLNVLCEWLLPFVRVGGKALCYKGPAAGDELAAAARASAHLGGGEPITLPVSLPSQPEWQHCVIRIDKLQKTARQYPRKAGTASREPLGVFD